MINSFVNKVNFDNKQLMCSLEVIGLLCFCVSLLVRILLCFRYVSLLSKHNLCHGHLKQLLFAVIMLSCVYENCSNVIGAYIYIEHFYHKSVTFISSLACFLSSFIAYA